MATSSLFITHILIFSSGSPSRRDPGCDTNITRRM